MSNYIPPKDPSQYNIAKKSPKKKVIAIPTEAFLDTGKVPHNRRASDSTPNETTIAAMQEARAIARTTSHSGVEIPMPTGKIGMLQRAHLLINGDRQSDYGDKLQNFSQIAMLFQGTLATKLLPDATITAEDVALLMIQVKIARLAKSPDHKDSILDVAGYAGCYDMLQEERANGYELKGATYDRRAGE